MRAFSPIRIRGSFQHRPLQIFKSKDLRIGLALPHTIEIIKVVSNLSSGYKIPRLKPDFVNFSVNSRHHITLADPSFIVAWLHSKICFLRTWSKNFRQPINTLDHFIDKNTTWWKFHQDVLNIQLKATKNLIYTAQRKFPWDVPTCPM